MIDVVISRCLLGENCRYDGGANKIDKLCDIQKKCRLIPVCPEVLGGLDTPRLPSEIQGNRVVMKDGRDVTEEFLCGAQKALEIAKGNNCTVAILKAKSPSCGRDIIYDGSFSGTLTNGDGVFAAVLKRDGLTVFTEKETEKILEFLQEEA